MFEGEAYLAKKATLAAGAPSGVEPDGVSLMATAPTLGDSLPAATDGSAAGDSGTTAGEAKSGDTVIELNGKELNGDADAGNKLPGGNEKWGWEKDGTLNLTGGENGFTVTDLTVKEGDLLLQVSGLNLINKLVTDSVVNIIGTGILLLDDYDLRDSGEVKLTENKMYTADTGVTGSVAVFLKDKDTSQENTYKLINKGIPGILDEAYVIPENIHLILPAGESLIMNSTAATYNNTTKWYDYESGKASSDTIEQNAGELYLSKGATLTVEKGAALQMYATELIDGTELAPVIGVSKDDPNAAQAVKVEEGALSGFYEIVEATRISRERMEALVAELKNRGVEKATYDDLRAACEACGYGEPLDAFAIGVKGDGTKVIKKDSGDKIKVPENWTDWFDPMEGHPATGVGLVKHQLGSTGMGLITAGSKFPEGKSTTILKAAAAETDPWRVIVTENRLRGTWTLSVWYGDTQIFDLGTATVRARFGFNLPDDWDGKDIYAVFLDKQNNLRAIPATYNPVTRELSFDSSLVGEFVVVRFAYSGELYSRDFYDQLAELDAVRHLVELNQGK